LPALAVASSRRIATLPATATLGELGHDGFATPSWIGLMAPARLPAPIAERLSADAMAVADTPEGRARIEQAVGKLKRFKQPVLFLIKPVMSLSAALPLSPITG
jgi:tripartite-type tricarboxylate transporter receptor subunit TctC